MEHTPLEWNHDSGRWHIPPGVCVCVCVCARTCTCMRVCVYAYVCVMVAFCSGNLSVNVRGIDSMSRNCS